MVTSRRKLYFLPKLISRVQNAVEEAVRSSRVALITARAGRWLLDNGGGSYQFFKGQHQPSPLLSSTPLVLPACPTPKLAGDGRVIPLLPGAGVFPEAQPREWAATANSSLEGLRNKL